MSRAAVSLATTQPRSSRPSTSGRMPWGSRAAYSVDSSIQTKRVGALELGQQLDGALLERGVRVVGEQRGHQRGVVGAGLELAGAEVELVELDGQVGDHLLELAGVGQVAVVAPARWSRRPWAGRSAGRCARCWRRSWSSASGRSRGGP